MSNLTGIYPGTFDPITNGHVNVIKRALSIVDRLIVAVADDVPKTPVFSLEKRVEMVLDDVKHLETTKIIDVLPFHGLLVNFAEENQASVIIRGLRAVSDFEYEFQLAAINTKLKPEIQTIFLPASDGTQFIASRMVKEAARLGVDISQFVSENVAMSLKLYYSA